MSTKKAYVSVFRGLRRYYADREGNDSTATFSAMAALSAIQMWFVVSTLLILKYAFSDGFSFGLSRSQERLLIVALGGVVLVANWVVARRLGLYQEELPDAPARWVIYLKVLLAVCVLLLVGLIATALYAKK
jgi:hypothetical protein